MGDVESESPAPNEAELEAQLTNEGRNLLLNIRDLEARQRKFGDSVGVQEVSHFTEDDGTFASGLTEQDISTIDRILGIEGSKPVVDRKDKFSHIQVIPADPKTRGIYKEILCKSDGTLLQLTYGFPVATRRGHYWPVS